ncbi:unnamed protein product, partial [Rotaria sordida]
MSTARGGVAVAALK